MPATAAWAARPNSSKTLRPFSSMMAIDDVILRDKDANTDWDAVRGDLDLDGDNDHGDRTAISGLSGNSLGFGVISLVGNCKGYTGYEFDDVLQDAYRLYHVRHRVLNSDLGRWSLSSERSPCEPLRRQLYKVNSAAIGVVVPHWSVLSQ